MGLLGVLCSLAFPTFEIIVCFTAASTWASVFVVIVAFVVRSASTWGLGCVFTAPLPFQCLALRTHNPQSLPHKRTLLSLVKQSRTINLRVPCGRPRPPLIAIAPLASLAFPEELVDVAPFASLGGPVELIDFCPTCSGAGVGAGFQKWGGLNLEPK